MKNQRRMTCLRGMAIAVAIAVVFSSAGSVYAGSMSNAQKEKESLQGDLDEAKELINSLKDSKQDAESAISALDQKLTDISGRIEDLKAELEQKEIELEETQEQLSQAEQEESQQFENMKIRIKYMYESYGSMNAITMLLSCSSFSEFLNQAQYMYMINQYDRQQLEKYQETVAFVTEAKETLEQDKAQIETMEQQVEEEKNAVDLLMKEKEQQLNSINADLSEAEIEAKEIEAEIAAQNEIIAQIQAAEQKRKEEEAKKAEEAKKQQENEASTGNTASGSSSSSSGNSSSASGSSSSGGLSGNIHNSNAYTGGVFTWPCPASQRITSDFGYRTSPTAGASSYHKGIDIGAPYGSNIVAAADGTVFNVAYQPNGAGNYVVVSHGGGIYTVYMHCSSVAVSAGQKVSKGQVIAYVGSTGISTGNHLHFGVQVNGSYVSPWDYLK